MKKRNVEIGKEIPGYEGRYEVSTFGNVRSLNYNKKKIVQNLVQRTNKKYLQVALAKDGKVKEGKIHKLVAMTFIENPNNLPQVDHIDENKLNNNVTNLQGITGADNVRKSCNKPIKCIETGATYESIISAAKTLNISRELIYRSLYKKVPTHGMTFVFLKEIK